MLHAFHKILSLWFCVDISEVNKLTAFAKCSKKCTYFLLNQIPQDFGLFQLFKLAGVYTTRGVVHSKKFLYTLEFYAKIPIEISKRAIRKFSKIQKNS